MKSDTPDRKSVGHAGEDIGCQFLESKGFKVLERNYRRPWGEIDIVAEKDGIVRFIEVKATTGDSLHFYWSINEMNVAKKKKDLYWIYMMTNFNETKPHDTIPILIQNPEHNIPKHSYLTMEAHKFLVREIAEVELSKHNIDEIMWYQLV